MDPNRLWRNARYLSWFTVLYNLVEGVLSVSFGWEDEALTLMGFGVDSFIETLSAFGILLLVNRQAKGGVDRRSSGERLALRITGTGFYVLAASLVVTAGIKLYTGEAPHTTLPGLIISSISISIMWLLIVWKRRLGNALNSPALIADANCNLVCIYMSLVLLASSGLYYLLPWPYWDSLGALALAWFSIKEGKEAFEKASGDLHCGCSH